MEGSTNSEGSSKTMGLPQLIRLATRSYGLDHESFHNFVLQVNNETPDVRERKDLLKKKLIEYLEDEGYPHEGVVEGGNQGGKKKKPKKNQKNVLVLKRNLKERNLNLEKDQKRNSIKIYLSIF